MLLAGFGLAAWLRPDARGYGTHQQLGLPECTFQTLFAKPCPGCGMTTSFANFVRGRWAESFQANPAGLLMAISCAIIMPWTWVSAWHGELFLVRQPWPVLGGIMVSWGLTSLIVCAMRWWS